MSPILQLLIGAGIVAICVFAWVTRVPNAWRGTGRTLRMWSDPQPDEWPVSRHARASLVTCGACGAMRPWPEMISQSTHSWHCPSGECRRPVA